MHYYGGKYRTGKEIAEILKQIIAKNKIKGYIEPFCGALGVLRHMTGDYFNCYASDGCEDLIMLWKLIQEGKFRKPNMTETKWLKLKNSEPSALRAYAGFGCSFSGQWFQAYSQKYIGTRDQNQESYDGLMKISPFIKDVTFKYGDYKKHSKKIEKGGYLIYCDPPYIESCIKHKASLFDFDHKEFWNVMRLWKSWGNIVVISERIAPRDFKCIWRKKLTNTPARSSGSTTTETYSDKLFI